MDYKIIGAVSLATLVAGIIGFSVFGKKRDNPKNPPAVNSPADQRLTKQILVRILQQLKYKILNICLEKGDMFKKVYTEAVANNVAEERMNQAIQGLAIKGFKDQERNILLKFDVTQEEFQTALEKTYVNDKAVQAYQHDLEDMLLRLCKGQTPDISVPGVIREKFTLEITFQIQKALTTEMFRILILGLDNELTINPGFSTANKQDLISLIRKINIYERKNEFLKENYPEINMEIFIKLIQNYKRESSLFLQKFNELDDIYSEFFDPSNENLIFELYKKKFETVTFKKQEKPIVEKKKQQIFPLVAEVKVQEKVEEQPQRVSDVRSEPKDERTVSIERSVESEFENIAAADESKEQDKIVKSVEQHIEESAAEEILNSVDYISVPIVTAIVEAVAQEQPKQVKEPIQLGYVEIKESVQEPIAEHVVEPVEPAVEPTVQPVAQVLPEPTIETEILPAQTKTQQVQAKPEPIVEAVVEPVIQPVFEPITQPTVEIIAEPVAEPVVQPIVQQVIEPIVESVEQPTVNVLTTEQPSTQQIVEPVQTQVIEPVDQPKQEYQSALQLQKVEEPSAYQSQQPQQDIIEPTQTEELKVQQIPTSEKQDQTLTETPSEKSEVTTQTSLAQPQPKEEEVEKRMETEESVAEDNHRGRKNKKNKNKNK